MGKQKLAIGIDIGGTNIELAWVSPEGKYIKHHSYPTNSFPELPNVINALGDYILEQNQLLDEYDIIGIGIGAPNGNYYKGTIEFAPNLNWEGVLPLVDLFKKKTGLPTCLTNDANAAAYAEMIFGKAQNVKNFAVITLGTGLGSGIVVNGQMLYGHTGFAGELGHTVVIENGRPCGCGKKGCLETYVSATAIVKTMNELFIHSKAESLLSNLEKIEAKDVAIAAEKGDSLALQAFDYTAKILSLQLSDFIALFSPEVIYLSGGLAKSHQILLPLINKYLNQDVLRIFKNTTSVEASQFVDSNSGVIGAAAFAFQELGKN